MVSFTTLRTEVQVGDESSCIPQNGEEEMFGFSFKLNPTSVLEIVQSSGDVTNIRRVDVLTWN